MISRRLLLPIDVCMVLFAISALIGTLTAYDRALSYPMALTIVCSVGLYFLIAYAVRTWEMAYGLAVVLMILGVSLALLFMTQYGHQNYPDTPAFIARIGAFTTLPINFGVTIHPNSAATFIEGMIPLGVLLAITARKPGLGVVWIVLVLLLLYAVFISYSRGAWIALAVALVVGAVTFSRRMAIITSLVLLVAVVGLFIIGIERLSPLQSALEWTQSRYELYRNSLYVAGDYAITGVGLGDVFALIYSRYGLLIQVPFLTYTHNLPLAIWFGQGILGLIAFFGLLVTFALYVRHVLASSQPRRLFHGTWLAVVAILVHGLFDARQYAEPGWVMPMLFVFIGLSAALGRLALADASRRSRDVTPDFVPLALPIGAAVVALVAGAVFFPQLRAILATNNGALDETRAELTPNLNDVQRADLLESAREQYQQALTYDANWPNANRRLGNLDVKMAEYAAAVPLLESAYSVEVANPATVKGLGLAYTWAGRTDDAADIFLSLPDARNIKEELDTWGNWRSSQGEYDLAAFAYEASAKMATGTPEVILWLVTAHNYRAANRLDSARIWYERVIEVEPDNEMARNALAELDADAASSS